MKYRKINPLKNSFQILYTVYFYLFVLTQIIGKLKFHQFKSSTVSFIYIHQVQLNECIEKKIKFYIGKKTELTIVIDIRGSRCIEKSSLVYIDNLNHPSFISTYQLSIVLEKTQIPH